MNPTFEQAKRYGFIFPGARMWATPENRARIAQDAALITTPNTTVPAELLAYIDPMVIEILTAPRRAREIFGEEKKGDWTTPYMKWRVDEMTGKTEPYSDYANGTTSGVNSEWQTRVQYVFQTSITYGDFEVDMSSTAKVNLPAAITAGATGTGGSTKWADKTTVQIYNDVLALFAQLSEQSSGLIDKDTPLKLCLSPELAVRLGAATDFNVSVLDMLKRYFTRIDIVTVPELHSMTAGETMFLIAPEVNGQRAGTLAFGEKMRAGRVVPDLSSFRQKFVGTTYGGIVLMPFAFAQMTGA